MIRGAAVRSSSRTSVLEVEMTSAQRKRRLILGGCLLLGLWGRPVLVSAQDPVSGQDRVSVRVGGGPVVRDVSADVRGGQAFVGVSVSLAPAVAVRAGTSLAVGDFTPDGEQSELRSLARFDVAAVLRWARSGYEPYVAMGLGYGTRNVGDDVLIHRKVGGSIALGVDSGAEGAGWFAEVSPRYRSRPLLSLTIGRVW